MILHFEAVAGECVVVINGWEIAHNFDSHLPFEADITNWVNTKGENEVLAIDVYQNVNSIKIREHLLEPYNLISKYYLSDMFF